MQRIGIGELEPGMIIGRTIFNSDGKPLLVRNTRLTEHYIDRLERLGLTSVYIKNDLHDIEIPEVTSTVVKTSVIRTLKDTYQTIQTRGQIDVRALQKSVNLLIDNIMNNRDVLFGIYDICTLSDSLLYHSTNVAILSIMTGISLQYNEMKLVELGTGVLLHDIGTMTIDPQTLNKPNPLNAQEIAVIRKHPEHGFNILRGCDNIPLLSAHIAFQHHERCNGTGYPRGLVRANIHEYAGIAAIADVFDALISDRPYRRGYPINDVITILRKLADEYFSLEILEAFSSNIAVYPIGTIVELSTGDLALIQAVSKQEPMRPQLIILQNKDNSFDNFGSKIDLTKERQVEIIRVLSEVEFKTLNARLKKYLNQGQI